MQSERAGGKAEGKEARTAESRRGEQPESVVLQEYETGKWHRGFRCFLWVCPGSFSPVSVSFPRPFPSFSKVSLKVVAQLYDKKAACSWCHRSSNCSFTDTASSPPSVQGCSSGSLGHLPFWSLLPSCTSEPGMPGFLSSPKGSIAAS